MVKHPFIQLYKGFKEDQDRYYIFSKYIEGLDLFSFLKELSNIERLLLI